MKRTTIFKHVFLWKERVLLLLAVIFSILILAGCSFIRVEEEPHSPVEYQIIKQEELPDELIALIDEKKETEFQLTYQSNQDLYLIKGYGRQMSGGYSIQVKELGRTSQAVFFQTKLLGPSDGKSALSPPSYPYIAVKMKYQSEPVIFERA